MDTLRWLLEGETIKQRLRGPVIMFLWVFGWTIVLLAYAIMLMLAA